MSKMSKAIVALGVVAGLGVAALPLGTYAKTTEVVPVTVDVGGSISIAADDNAAIEIDAMVNAAVATDSVNFTVSTNNAKGYTVSIRGENGVTDLTDTAKNNTLPTGTPTQGTNAWGYVILEGKDASLASASFAPVPAAYEAVTFNAGDTTTKGTAAAEGGDFYTLGVGVTVNSSQPDGTYEGGIQLTAAVNQ